MEWEEDNGRYQLQHGEYLAEVWQTTDGTWIARVETPRYAPGMGRFPTLEDAQVWCLTELANIHRADRGE